MWIRVVAFVFLGFLQLGTTCNHNVAESDASGNVTAWWVTIDVQSGYPIGEPRFFQSDASGNAVEAVSTTVTTGASLYEGAKKSYSVRIRNRDACKDPCGYFHAIICPSNQPSCETPAALRDFGVIQISNFDMSI